MGYEQLSQIQALAIPRILQGKRLPSCCPPCRPHLRCEAEQCCTAGGDVVCKAKTGTGKTLAFLIPAVDRLLAAQAQGRLQPGGVAALIMSPSRELAMQIAAEAQQLLRFHNINAEVTA